MCTMTERCVGVRGEEALRGCGVGCRQQPRRGK